MTTLNSFAGRTLAAITALSLSLVLFTGTVSTAPAVIASSTAYLGAMA